MANGSGTLRIGVIGVGFGSVVHLPGLQSEDGIEVVSVTARREERAREAAERFGIPRVFTDYREMLASDDIDAVSIASPLTLHCEMACAALEAGKHVICEKPTAVDVGEARMMRDAARRHPELTAMIAHEFRWAPQRASVKELVDQGYIGNLHLVRGHLFTGFRNPVRPRQAPARDLGLRGGFWWSQGSHYFDALRHWFGDIVSVQALLVAQYPERVDADGRTVTTTIDDTFSVTCEFANGGIGTFTGSNVAAFGQGAEFEIFGTEGSLSIPQLLPRAMNPSPDGKVYGARFGADEGPERKELPMPERFRPFVDDRDQRLLAFRLMVRSFLEGVRTGTSPAPNFEDGYRIQQVLDAAVESQETGRKVAITFD
jgi:predicted dehydrogenase